MKVIDAVTHVLTVAVMAAGATAARAQDRPWRDHVVRCLDTLIEKGTDHYGPVHTPMLMSILDVNTLTSPEDPPLLDAKVRTEDRPGHGRRSPGGSNLWMDMPTIRVMYRLSEVTGDGKYARAADAYIRSAYERAIKPNGLLAWGSHIYYHAFKDKPGGDGDGAGPHEILIKHAVWQRMYRVNPKATRREVDGIWDWHVVDKKTGQHNRHDDRQVGCDFAFSGGTFAMAFAAMYVETKEPGYLDKAKLMAEWHWNHRNHDTNLAPDAPSTGSRYDAHHCFTTITGPHASQLLRCYEMTGERYFADVAFAYIKAYDQYGWDEQARTYHGMLTLDGTPLPPQARGSGYDVWKPDGHVDVWRTTMYSYEMPLIAAQAAVYAYELSGKDTASRDPALLAAARRWAGVIERNLPVKTGRRWKKEVEQTLPEVEQTGGGYAENHGRAVSFFASLYQATGEEKHLRRAEALAADAIEKLYVNGLFRGHPAKDYYQANDGVGFLLHALMQLDAAPEKWRPAF